MSTERRSPVALVLCLALAAACGSNSSGGGGGGGVAVGSVALAPASATLEVGDSATFSATLSNASGTPIAGPSVTWASSDTTIATVDGSGKVTAAAPGECDISASAGGASNKAHVKVVPKTFALSIALKGSGSGKVTSAPAGIDCGTTCQAALAANTAVVLTATPASDGSTFHGWTGACSGTDACRVTLSADTSATATFDPPPPNHSITVAVTGNGTVTSTPSGIDCSASGGSCTARFPAGSTVTLSQSPDSGSFFSAWGGAASCGAGAVTCNLVASSDLSASAAFAAGSVLTVTLQGNGGITSSPAGINCSQTASACSAVFPVGTAVTLTGAAGAGAKLSHWVGGACGTATTCPLTLSADAAVTAVFAQQVALSVTVSGAGSVTSSPPGITCSSGTCNGNFDSGASVILSAAAASGSAFTGWSDACSGLTSCTLTMSAPRSASANFIALHTVTIQVSGTGNVTSSNSAIACNGTGTCSATFKHGDPLNLSAAAGSGFFFSSFSGGGCGSSSTCNTTVNADATITATFSAGAALNVNVVGSGSVGSSPAAIACPGTCNANYLLGQSVQLTATPSNGFAFSGWSGGGCSGIGTCTTSMTATQNVTATFTALPVLTASVTGNGSITSSPGGLNCSAAGGTCKLALPSGTIVNVFASAGTNASFGFWGGTACTGSTSPCQLTLTNDATVSATFGTFFGLAFTSAGPGKVSADSGTVQNCTAATCNGNYPVNTNVTLTATANSGAAILQWTGACAGTVGTQCVVPMTKAQTAGITFANNTTLSIFSGDAQSAPITAALPLPIVIKVLNNIDNSPAPNTPVTLAGPAGAAITQATVNTDGSGKASFFVRLSRNAVLHTFTASAPTAAATINATATATAPAQGSIFTLVNSGHVSGNNGIPGPATAAHIGQPSGLALSKDGTLFISDATNQAIYALSSAGILTLLAGSPTGVQGSSGDNGPASAALFSSPRDLALDESNAQTRTLYVADSGNLRVRAIDLTVNPPVISNFAGGGSPASGNGDGGAATAARLSSAVRIGLSPDGHLAIGDSSAAHVRAVNIATGIIDSYAGNGDGNFCLNSACAMAWDASGAFYVSNYFSSVGQYRVSRQNLQTGAAPSVAGGGGSTGTNADGAYAVQAMLSGPPSMVFDNAVASGSLLSYANLLVIDPGNGNSGSMVRRVDPGTSRINTVAGTGVNGSAGDFGPALGAQLNGPWTGVMDPQGNLIISDSGNNAVRMIMGVGLASSPRASMALAGGDQQSPASDQNTAPMQVKILDPGGNPMPSYQVTFNVVDAGGALYGAAAGANNQTAITTTNSSGVASAIARVGRTVATNAWHFTANATDFYGQAIPSLVTFTQSSSALPSGYFFGSVNTWHVSGFDGFPGPASLAHIGRPQGVAYDSFGNLFISDGPNSVIYKLTPAGTLTRVAGNGQPGYSGDGGPAAAARLSNPYDVVVDQTNGRYLLYVADSSNAVVRAVDLSKATPTISTLAGCTAPVGSGCQTTSPYGDGGPATAATLTSLTHITLDAAGNFLYIPEPRGPTQGVRRVDLTTGGFTSGTISTWADMTVVGDGNYCLNGGCKVVFDSHGTPFVNRYVSSAGTYGIDRIDSFQSGTNKPNRTLVVGGTANADPVARYNDNVPALGAYFQVFNMFIDASDNLYIVDAATPRVRVLTDKTTALSASTNITTVAGVTTGGAAGTYVAGNGADNASATQVQLNAPAAATVSPDGRLVVADTGNFVVRETAK